jgi:hypothetical protein
LGGSARRRSLFLLFFPKLSAAHPGFAAEILDSRSHSLAVMRCFHSLFSAVSVFLAH